MIAAPSKQSLAYIQKTYISDPCEILGKYYSKSFVPQIKSALNNTFLYENHDQNYYKVVHFDEKNKVLGQYKTKTKVQMNVKSVCLGLDYMLFAHQKCQNNTGLVKQTWFQFGIWNLKTHQYIDTGIKYIKTSEQIQLFYFSQSKLFCVSQFTKNKGIILNYYQVKQFNEQLFLKVFLSCVSQLQRDQFQGQSRQDLKLKQVDQISSFAIFKQKTTRNYIQIKLLSLLVKKRQHIIRHCRFEHGFHIQPNQSVVKLLKIQQISKNFVYIDLETQSNLTYNQQQANFNMFNQRHQPQPQKILYFFKQKSFFIKLVKQGIQINEYEMPEPYYNIQFVNKPSGKLRNTVKMPQNKNIIIPSDILKYFVCLPLYFLYFDQQTHECLIVQKIQQVGQVQISPQNNEYIFTKWNKSTMPYNGQLQLTRVTVKSIFDPKFVYAAFFMEEIVKKGECDCDLLDQITQML